MTGPALPTKLKVGHLDYTVVEITEAEASAEGAFADIDHEQGVIRVQANLHPQVKAEKVLHELLHGAFDAWKISGRWGEEKTVTALAPAIACIFRDNPRLVDWLRDTLR